MCVVSIQSDFFPGGYSTKFYVGTLRFERVQPLNLLKIIFDGKSTPFACLLLTNGTHFVITQRATGSSGYWTDILISIKCPEGTNETEYIMSLAARANEIQHRAWKLLYYNTFHIPSLEICILFLHDSIYSQTPLYGHLIITDSLLCPWGKKTTSNLI